MEEQRFREDLNTLYNYQKGGCSEVGVGLFSQLASKRERGKGLSLCQGRFRLDTGKYFFTGRFVKHWNKLPRQLVKTPSLKIFKRHIDASLRNIDS